MGPDELVQAWNDWGVGGGGDDLLDRTKHLTRQTDSSREAESTWVETLPFLTCYWTVSDWMVPSLNGSTLLQVWRGEEGVWAWDLRGRPEDKEEDIHRKKARKTLRSVNWEEDAYQEYHTELMPTEAVSTDIWLTHQHTVVHNASRRAEVLGHGDVSWDGAWASGHCQEQSWELCGVSQHQGKFALLLLINFRELSWGRWISIIYTCNQISGVFFGNETSLADVYFAEEVREYLGISHITSQEHSRICFPLVAHTCCCVSGKMAISDSVTELFLSVTLFISKSMSVFKACSDNCTTFSYVICYRLCRLYKRLQDMTKINITLIRI